MVLQIELLKTFLAVAESGSFTKAGEMVNVTQSAVSMQMKRLEEEVGKPVFEKSGRSFKLTHVGEALLEHAQRIAKAHDEAVADFSNPELQGRIRFGCPEDYASRFLPQLLFAFRKARPHIRVEIYSATSVELKAAVDCSDLDLALCAEITEGGKIVYREPVVWASSGSTRIYEDEPLPLAVYHDGCVFRKWAIESLRKAGKKYWIAFVSPSVASILAAVSTGLAVAPVGLSNVPADIRILGPENGFPLLPVTNIALHRSSTASGEVVDCFGDYVAESFRKLEKDNRSAA